MMKGHCINYHHFYSQSNCSYNLVLSFPYKEMKQWKHFGGNGEENSEQKINKNDKLNPTMEDAFPIDISPHFGLISLRKEP